MIESKMNMDDMEMFANIVWKRMQQLLDARVNPLEQERYRFFMWLMRAMEEAVELEYPHTGRIIRRFEVKKIGQRRVEVSTDYVINKTFTSLPAVESEEFLSVIAEVVNFIETLDGYIIRNRFPKDDCKKVEDFQIIVDYSSRQNK